MNDSSKVIYEIKDNVATLTLNRPEVRNAFDDQTIALLTTHIEQIENDKKIRVVVLRGYGEHFSAGGDIHWMQRMAAYSKEENQNDALKLAKLINTLYLLNKPTIIVLQGSVYGGATGLVAASDIALATPDAKFCFSEVKLGLAPAVVGPYVLNAIGERAAKYYMLTAEPFNAEKAYELGFIHEIIPQDQIESRLMTLIQLIKQNGPEAIQATKKLIHTIFNQDNNFEDIMVHTANILADLRVSKEGQMGLKAFLEKRKPSWE